MKKEMLIIIAIILAILICWANLHITFNTGGWVNAGMEMLIVAGGIILLHGLLLFALIWTAKNFPLGLMTVVWGLLIFIYFVPALVSHIGKVENQKQNDAKWAAESRINEGTATMDDFIYLYDNRDIEIIINAYKRGYGEIAEKLLTVDCDPSSDRIFNFNNSIYGEDFSIYVKKYGKETARKKVLGLWLNYVAADSLPEIIKCLLTAGANVNEHTKLDHTTPLMAAAAGQLDNVRLFLEQGADINAMDTDGNDALFFAVSRNQIEIVKLLIEHGADLDRKYVMYRDQPRVPLLTIAQYNNEEWYKDDKSKDIVELLTQKSHIKR